MDISTLVPIVMPWLIRVIPTVAETVKSHAEDAFDTITDKALEKTGENISDGAWGVGKSLLKKLLPEFLSDPAAKKTVEKIAKAPDNPDYQTVLKVQLADLLEDNQGLRAEIERIVSNAQRAGVEISITASGERSVAAKEINAPVFTGDIRIEKKD